MRTSDLLHSAAKAMERDELRGDFDMLVSNILLNRVKDNVPFSQRLNDWIVNWFQSKDFEVRFTDEDDFDESDPYKTFLNHQQRYHEDGIIYIWTGASDKTVFGNAVVNHYFRAWHDYVHLEYGYDYSPVQETIVCQIQKDMLPEDWDVERLILDAEVTGQVQYFAVNNRFVHDQRRFAAMYLTDVRETLLNGLAMHRKA